VVRNIIFDWSGTLVDDLRAVWQATNGVFQQAGVAALDLERFRSEFSLPYLAFYARYVSHVPPAELETWFRFHFEAAQDSITELPRARSFLSFCRARGLRTFVLSAVFRDHFEAQSTRLGFRQFIDHPYVEVRDKRLVIGKIIEQHQLDRAETLLVGDMEHDIEAAHAGRIRACAVLTGYNRLDQFRSSQPDLIVEHLDELRSVLEHDFKREREEMGTTEPGCYHPIATVGGLIFNPSGQVLMIRTKKWSDLWGIPGGKIKYGETSLEALQRELKEETDLDVTGMEFVLVQDSIRSKEFYRDAHFVLLNYTCRCPADSEVRLNDEAQEFRWMNPRDALSLPLNQPTRILIEAVLNKSEENG
jgi:phosphoglycolate phosphatase